MFVIKLLILIYLQPVVTFKELMTVASITTAEEGTKEALEKYGTEKQINIAEVSKSN